uniref:Glutamine-dependent NAD(+) synthetase n=1 Tax=Desulfacinum infernum TaxID=35837 RepID=A0A832A3D2_9BACT
MKIALAQINPLIGDFDGNARKIGAVAEKARCGGASLVIFPELALTGYPPRDLLDRPAFVRASLPAWDALARASRGLSLLCGTVCFNEESRGKPLHNAALFFQDGTLVTVAKKRLLPTYDVFDEDRYFEPGRTSVVVSCGGRRLGITVCEDIWTDPDYLPRPLYRIDPVQELRAAGMDVLINIAASPYHMGKAAWVGKLLQRHAVSCGVPVVYVNQVGGNDELIFQGRSMVWNARGECTARAADFAEDLCLYDLDGDTGDRRPALEDPTEEVLEALILGLRDYVAKCGFRRVVLGVSGGIDSAVTACIARLALGAENVLTVAMPGPFNAPESLEDAQNLASALGVPFAVLPIDTLFHNACTVLAPLFHDRAWDVTEENIQARVRGLLLMAVSNKLGHMVLNTGNKSELAVGYCTLYGDMNGGLSVLGDVPKTLVYALASVINRRHGWIPRRILEKAPSAELRPGQKDQDSLPPYDVLDAILKAYVEERKSVAEICAEGWPTDLVRSVVRRVDGNEYKRRQAPPVLRVTTKAFGSGRRCPIAHGYRED